MAYRKLFSGIYQIRNIVNGKIYIGCSTHIQSRWNNHRSRLRKGSHRNLHLQGAWQGYGERSFEFQILELVESEKLVEREQYWFDTTNCFDPAFGYNQNPFAGTTKGGKHRPASEERKRKIGDANRGRKHSEEQTRRHSEIMRGRKKPPRTEDHRRNLSVSMTGKKHSEETLKKLSESHKTDSYRANTKQFRSGENSRMAKLTWKTVDKIRQDFPVLLCLHGVMECYEILAGIHKVSATTICKVVNNKEWVRSEQTTS